MGSPVPCSMCWRGLQWILPGAWEAPTVPETPQSLREGRGGTWRCPRMGLSMWHCQGRMWWHLEVSKDVHCWRRDMVAPGNVPRANTGCCTAEQGCDVTWQCPRMWPWMWHCQGRTWWPCPGGDIQMNSQAEVSLLFPLGFAPAGRRSSLEGQMDEDGQRWEGGGTTWEDVVTCASCRRGGAVLPSWNSQRPTSQLGPQLELSKVRSSWTWERIPGPEFGDENLCGEENPKCGPCVFPPTTNHSHKTTFFHWSWEEGSPRNGTVTTVLSLRWQKFHCSPPFDLDSISSLEYPLGVGFL